MENLSQPSPPPDGSQDSGARGLPAERAARLLATWRKFMDAGEFEKARVYVNTLNDEDCALFLEAHREWMKKWEAGEAA